MVQLYHHVILYDLEKIFWNEYITESWLINYHIKDEKVPYVITREAAKISALSSGKINKYEYLAGEKILPSNQKQIIEQVRFTHSTLGKAFKKA